MSAPEPCFRVLEHPEMKPVLLDVPAVERLFEEVAFETTVLGVVLRANDTDETPLDLASVRPNLRHARAALLSGQASGVQLRYVHGGAEWFDTVMRTQAGYRVVRVRKPPPPP